MPLEIEITGVVAPVQSELTGDINTVVANLDAGVSSAIPVEIWEHIRNKNNPHETTATKTPISPITGITATNVQGALEEIASGGGGSVDTITVDGVVYEPDVNKNITLPNYPTKTSLGLGNVDNTSDATKKTNFTGSIASGDTGFVTGGAVYLHTSNVNNPHSVTKAQVGLGNVENKTMDTTPTADSDNYVTSGGVKTYVDTYGGKIDVIKKNGVVQPIVDKAVDLAIPVKTSDITNDSNYVSDANYLHITVSAVNGVTDGTNTYKYIPDLTAVVDGQIAL